MSRHHPHPIFLNSPKDRLLSAINSCAWATWKTNCLPSTSFAHTHTYTTLSELFFFLHRFIYISLLYSSLFTSVSPQSLAPFSPSLSFSHTYIQTYLLTTVFHHWSPFEKHLIRKAWDAHILPPSPTPHHHHTHLLLALSATPTLLSCFNYIVWLSVPSD